MESFIEINTDHLKPPNVGDDLYSNRMTMAKMQSRNAEVTIFVQAYNRLEKTRRCVESVLRYTKGIDYELLLIDNGSTDGTLEYFKSVPWENKRILHVTTNVGSFTPYPYISMADIGEFLAGISNDLIVTEHWLDNLMRCIKSDPQIGLVNPISSNVSNLQEVTLNYSSFEEMQQKARKFNVSDPRKWQQRQRLITLGTLFRKEALLSLGWPYGDVGFFHDFSDDDLIFRLRRMGYKTVLAGDTWICHDHDFRRGENKNPVEFKRSLEIGRQNFRDKYFSVDAWDDVNNYYIPYLPHFPKPPAVKACTILGVDVRCGTPILDIKNWLRTYGIFHTKLSAFVQDAKYWMDLKTICEGTVVCDREEFLVDSFLSESFDYVVADQPLNRYHEPAKMIRDLFNLCKKGGYVVCKLTNSYSFREYLTLLGQKEVYNPAISYNITPERFQSALGQYGTVQTALPVGEGSNICNFKCRYCAQSLGREYLEREYTFPPENMPLEIMKLVVSQASEFPKRFKLVSMMGHGEPLCNTKLPEMVGMVKESGIAERVDIITNASLLTHEYSDRLLDAGLDVLRVSLQGIDSQAY